jgi:ABC-type glycerol-3-phosphate transport system permease component
VSLWQILANNIIYTTASVVGIMLIAAPASFAFATMRFRGKRIAFLLILAPLIMPVAMLLIPEFIDLKILNVTGGYHSLILPEIAFSLALPTLIMTTYFRGLPREVLESARQDGANNVQLFQFIALPMARPALATSVILQFLSIWNEYPLALVAIQNPQLWNLSLALSSIQQGRSAQVPWELIGAAIVIASIPVTLVFIAFQRQVVEGLIEGSVKA